MIFIFTIDFLQNGKRIFEHRVKDFLMHYEFIGKEIEISEQMQMLIAGTYVMLTLEGST
jgi:hypothetical protein